MTGPKERPARDAFWNRTWCSRYHDDMRMLVTATVIAACVLSVPLMAQPESRLGAAAKRHSAAPPEVAELEFLLGKWKLQTTFRNADGTERHTEAELEGSYILSGYGIQVVEVHTPDPAAFAEVGETFVSTMIFNYDTDSDRWSGASVNSLGNRKFLDGGFEDGELVLTQSGKLFRNRQGRNRLTFFNITDDRFELRLDSYHEREDRWSVGGYSYVATRITP